MEMKKVYVTLRALLDVLEILVGQSPTDRLHRQILEEVIHGKTPDQANILSLHNDFFNTNFNSNYRKIL